MQGKRSGKTSKTFRRQVRFPFELVEKIEKLSSVNGFSKWVIAACEREIKRLEAEGDGEPGDCLQ
jgi:hypothetical protein